MSMHTICEGSISCQKKSGRTTCIVSLPCLLVIADGLPALRTLPMFRGALRLTCSERACKKMLQKASVPSGPVLLFQKHVEKNKQIWETVHKLVQLISNEFLVDSVTKFLSSDNFFWMHHVQLLRVGLIQPFVGMTEFITKQINKKCKHVLSCFIIFLYFPAGRVAHTVPGEGRTFTIFYCSENQSRYVQVLIRVSYVPARVRTWEAPKEKHHRLGVELRPLGSDEVNSWWPPPRCWIPWSALRDRLVLKQRMSTGCRDTSGHIACNWLKME